MRRWWALAPLLLLGLLVALSAIMLARGGERATFSTGMVGRPAPAFVLERLDGGAAIANADFAGRAYVVNLFASWCTPCRAEHPLLMELKSEGVTILGVAYKDRPGAAAQFLNSLGDPYAIVALDPDGSFGLDLGITGVPETFIVGADGMVLAAHRGPLTRETVEEIVLPALVGAQQPG